MNNKTTTIVSIDTGDPKNASSTTAIVKMIFDGDRKTRTAITYSGSFDKNKGNILSFIGDVDYIVIEKIDATNSFLARSVIAEQLGIKSFLTQTYGDKVQELVRSGRKHIITDDLLKKIELYTEGDHKTHHHDVRDATRNLLYFMAKLKELNPILSKYVQRFFK